MLVSKNYRPFGALVPRVLLLTFALLAGAMSGCATVTPGLNVQLPENVEIPDDPMVGRPRLEFKVKPLTPELIESLAVRYESNAQAVTYPDLENGVFEYRIGSHDVLQITVWDHPELTVTTPVAGSSTAGDPAGSKITGLLVDSTGKIFFPYVGEVTVANKTTAEVRKELTDKLSKFIPDPQLSVRVSGYRSKQVFVLGQVVKSGTVPLGDVPMHVLDAINMSGRWTEEADLRSAKLVRDGQSIDIDLVEIFLNGNLKQNYLLQDKDVIQVPDSNNKRVYMLGEFREPGALKLRNSKVTLADAVNSAGGLNENTSRASKILIFRMITEDDPVIYLFDANVPEHLLLALHFVMEPYDIVYVPPTGLTQWNRIVQQVLPTINSLSRMLIAIKNWQILID